MISKVVARSPSARATRGLGRPSLDARRCGHPVSAILCYTIVAIADSYGFLRTQLVWIWEVKNLAKKLPDYMACETQEFACAFPLQTHL